MKGRIAFQAKRNKRDESNIYSLHIMIRQVQYMHTGSCLPTHRTVSTVEMPETGADHKHGLDATRGRSADFDDDEMPDVYDVASEPQLLVTLAQRTDNTIPISHLRGKRRDVEESELTRSSPNCSTMMTAKSARERGTCPCKEFPLI